MSENRLIRGSSWLAIVKPGGPDCRTWERQALRPSTVGIRIRRRLR